MTNPELTNYIKVSLSKNIPKETIKSELLKVGWDTDVIEGAFSEVGNSESMIGNNGSRAKNTKVNAVENNSNSWLKPVGDKKYRIHFLIYVVFFLFSIRLAESKFLEKIFLEQNVSFLFFVLIILTIGIYFLYIIAGRLKYMNYSPYFVFISFIPLIGPLFGLLAMVLLLANYETVGNKKVKQVTDVTRESINNVESIVEKEKINKSNKKNYLVKSFAFNLIGFGVCFTPAIFKPLFVIPAVMYVLAIYYAFMAIIFINLKDKETGLKADAVTRIVIVILSLVSLVWTFYSVLMILLFSADW
ncbi:MAG: hypothetical protein R3B60_01920 [Candidatus Paceibacterota bacterium]